MRRISRLTITLIAVAGIIPSVALAGGGSALAASRTPAVVPATPVAGDLYKLVNLNNGDCLNDTGLGNPDYVYLCAQGSTAQKFTWQSTTTGGYFKLVNESSGGCADDFDGIIDGYVYDDPCAQGSGTERWTLQDTTTPGYFKLVNYASGGCLDDSYEMARANTCVQGSTTQKWYFQPAS